MSTLVKMVLDITRDHNRGIFRDPVEQESSQSPLVRMATGVKRWDVVCPSSSPVCLARAAPIFWISLAAMP